MKQFWDDKKREFTSIDDAVDILMNKGFSIIDKNNKDYKYDLLVKKDKKEHKVEVKQDFTCYKTNNIGVEYETRGKPSGIMTSEADIYIYKIHQNPKNIKKAKNEISSPNEVKIIRVLKTKLKNCIKSLLLENFENIEINKELELLGQPKRVIGTKVNTKKGFTLRKVITPKGLEYNVQVKFINGGDIGSNSLNVIFERNSFIENFTQEHYVNRKRTSIELKHLKEMFRF